MKVGETTYGLIERKTGRLARVDTRYYPDPEGGGEQYSYLVADSNYPLLQAPDLMDVYGSKFGGKFYIGQKGNGHYLLKSGDDFDNYDMVEFTSVPSSSARTGADATSYETRVGRIDFEIVDGVLGSNPDERSSRILFETFVEDGRRAEIEERYPDARVTRLRAEADVDVDLESLRGKVLAPSRKRLHYVNQGADGVLEVFRSGREVYGVVTKDVLDPFFYRVNPVGSQKAAERGDELPWSDCKVAFGFDGSENLLHRVWDDPRTREGGLFPKGWELTETDKSGARMVVIFRVQGDLTRADGNIVRDMVEQIETGIDPRPWKKRPESRLDRESLLALGAAALASAREESLFNHDPEVSRIERGEIEAIYDQIETLMEHDDECPGLDEATAAMVSLGQGAYPYYAWFIKHVADADEEDLSSYEGAVWLVGAMRDIATGDFDYLLDDEEEFTVLAMGSGGFIGEHERITPSSLLKVIRPLVEDHVLDNLSSPVQLAR